MLFTLIKNFNLFEKCVDTDKDFLIFNTLNKNVTFRKTTLFALWEKRTFFEVLQNRQFF